MKEDAVPIANPAIVLREEFDDWAILFDPDTGDAFGMNPVSVFIWKRLDGKRTTAELLAELKSDCDNVPEDAREHVREFVDDLVSRGLAGYKI